jgi:hypothetical protein
MFAVVFNGRRIKFVRRNDVKCTEGSLRQRVHNSEVVAQMDRTFIEEHMVIGADAEDVSQ